MLKEVQARKILGRKYLNENRLADALDVFSHILAEDPNDVETLQILGNFYLASGDGKTARKLYGRALELDPGNQIFARQMRLAEEINEVGLDEPIPTELQAVARMLQRLTGASQAITEEDVARAAELLETIVNSDSPANLVAQHLDEIDELLPALIELNIRQALADGRPELADSLRKLQINIDYQLGVKEEAANKQINEAYRASFSGSILFLLPDLEKISKRMALLKATLESFGCSVAARRDYVPARDAQPDVVITSNPHLNPGLLESLSAASVVGVPIILDLDADFEKQPISHSEYGARGLGTHSRSNAFTTAISLARMVTVPSAVHAAALETLAQNVRVIPDGWSKQNALWHKPLPVRKTINIGWLGTSGQLEDLLLVRRFVVRIIREVPNTKIVIVGNPQAYRLFESLPENRRMYLPAVSHEESPYQLSQMDILLAPLRNTPYNNSQPDTVLMEASAKGIPWLASAIPSFYHWQGGGILCNELDDWYSNLRLLTLNEERRHDLSVQGRRAAATREMDQVGKVWLEAIDQAASMGAVIPTLLTSNRVQH